MAERNDPKSAPANARVRSEPRPNPDQRRLLRLVQRPLKPGQVFTDWASI